MGSRGEERSRNYRALKERLWNQPRPRQFLERLEQRGASAVILERVAEKFASGEYGDGEIQAAICCELLQHRDRKACLKRVADLNSLLVKIYQDLTLAASWIYQLQSWESHKVMNYEDWGEFLEEILGLSSNTADALLMAMEYPLGLGLEGFLQLMIKGYVAPQVSEEGGSISSADQRKKRDSRGVINHLKMRLEHAEFKIGDEIRVRKQLEQELEKTNAEMYRSIQEKQAIIDKLTKNS